ncbi:MAG: hypothetical protein NZ957_06175 [Thaumarchaeota archaeon]|nr:hypothetical protein [Candidatus Calditenuaceae archaeon]MDW8042017.1 hypothetical protein [Nitrososphaerota archaeon]
MNWRQAIGTASSVIFAALVFISLASSPPFRKYWSSGTERLIPDDPGLVGRELSGIFWTGLSFPLVGIFLIILALAAGVTGLIVVLTKR